MSNEEPRNRQLPPERQLKADHSQPPAVRWH